ncbi:type IV pilus modification PilV family protein [Aromatoleum buckelii]|uniref:Prepilin-type N-terminal cleavage/methylation domain-containing protein n=1 Tax=Aromatoleum buckelii TaxID=200254 RepID=A0ABX1N495_9RHOO|nr:prepilin-type N-terminal cleavage/methylation domain-containing protein [Aromatoleum buckelii]MCK0511880.1 prepilin-type N-terminal cleavage/methylation domain-containing protein [Aromatoleum buckelii]
MVKSSIVQQRGFSLLEVLVALTIMALSLASLYHATGGSVRAMVEADRQTRALFLAQSMLAQYPAVPNGGVRDQGLYDDMRWRLISEAWPVAGDSPPVLLHRIVVEVEWSDRGRQRQLTLASIAPERSELR